MKKHLLFVFISALLIHSIIKAQTTELVYSLGKASTMNITSVTTDASENIFICGSYMGTNVNFNPLVPGADSLRTSNGSTSTDGFIAKYNSSGQLQKVIAFGNTGIDAATKVFADASGNIYMLANIAGSSVKFDNTGVGFPPTAGSGAMALVKYNNNLVLQISRLIGATNGSTTAIVGGVGDLLNDIKIVGTDIYVTGILANNNVNFNPGGSSQTLLNVTGGTTSITDIFVAKFDATTMLNTWAYKFGGTDSDGGNGIDIDGSGNIYVTGYFRGQAINVNPTGTTTVSEAGGGVAGSGATGDVFVAKYNSVMNCQWAFNIGAALLDQGNSILVEKTATPNIYVGGVVKNDALDVYFDPASTTTASFAGIGLNDLFVASYTSAGTYNWHIAKGSANDDNVSYMTFDAGGNIVLTGYVGGTVDFGNSKVVTGLGGKDAYFAVLPKGTGLTTAAYNVGGTGDEQGNGITVSPAGKILMAGNFSASGDYDPSSAVKTLTISGSPAQDGFVARYVLCTPPSISVQPTDVTKCAGAAASFSVTAGGATSYQWKNGTTNISGATTSSYNIAAVAAGDAGNYTVDVTNSCQTVTSNIAKLTVNPKPSITSSATSTVCSGVALAYAITSDVSASYSWSRATVTGITNAAVSGQTASSITETLVNSTNAAINVAYIITPTSTTGSCGGTAFTYTVTVNPTPSITSASSGAICSGVAENYTISSNIAASYSWSRASVAGITNAAVTGQSVNPISEILVNNSTSPVNVIYTITPTATTGSCAGTAFAYTATVNPKPVINSSSVGTVCSGIAQNYTIASNIASGYVWSRASVSGITNAAVINQSSNPIAETLINSSTNPVNVIYVITPTSTTGSCVGASFNYTVTVNPKPSVTSVATSTVCSGSSVGYTITSDITSNYSWSRAAVSGITNAAVTNQTSNPITESLTNSTASAQTVTYIITPTSSSGSCDGNPFNYAVTVNPVLAPTVSVSGATAICSGATLTLTATPANAGSAPTYQWKKGSTTLTGETNATFTTTTAANGDSYTVTVTSNAPCPSPAFITSSPAVITVTTTLTPTVSVSVNPGTTICAGTNSTFTATPSNAGSTPTYQWKKGSSVLTGETNSTYSTTAVANGDSYSVVVTSSSSCSSTPTVTSTPVTMTVNPVVATSVTITSGTTTICAGASITFNSTQSGGGTPTYKWKLGSTYIAGATSSSYTTTTASNNDSYSLEMTSSTACASPAVVTSSAITLTVNPVVTPSISITSGSTTICAGASITFNSTQSGGGTPAYKWKLGSTYITGATNSSYTTTTASNNDMYSLEMTSTALCANPVTVTSSSINVTVNPVLTPSVSITADNSTICTGTNITFTPTPTNGGTPSYQWSKNGSVITGATNATYSTNTAANNDSYTVTMVSNAVCASTTPVNSNAVVITITASPTPSVSISATPGNVICAGASVTFATSPSNGGTTPTYKWKLGSSYITGATNAIYTTTSAASNDSYSVEMTSSLSCVSSSTVLSNSIVMTVNAIQTPAVTVTTNPGTTICNGTSITFTASATGSGTVPAYQWKKGAAVLTGETNATYTTSTAANNDNYSVVVTSTGVCPSQPTVTSTPVILTVNAINIPSVAITSTATTICAGTSIKLTANASNQGSAPTYQWQNGSIAITGATNDTYTTTTASDGDSYSVLMTSNATCASPANLTSNSIVISVNPVQIPTVSISSSATTICAGASVTFNATAGTAGSSPTYQWKKGSAILTGETNAAYTTTTAANNDTYSVVVTSNAACPSTPTITSAPVTITVNPVTTPTVTVTASNNSICAGSSILFTTSVTNTGSSNLYQWFKGNTAITGETNSTYTTTTAANGDMYSVVASSNATCSSASSATSNSVTITVNPIVTPSVSITANNATICPGTSVTFTAAPSNGGTPVYKWKLGSTYISGATNATYTTTTAANNDSYSVEMTGNAACTSSNAAVTSNAVVITITGSVLPSVSITMNTGTTICSGTNVVFTAVVGNGGTTPTYQWKNNNTAISGATNSTYSSNSLIDGDKISVDIVSNSSCASTPNASSTQTVINVSPVLTPSVTVSPSVSSICAGDAVSFTATPGTGGGTAPKYRWLNNGTAISGATDAVYSTTSLVAGNLIAAELTSNATCVTTAVVTSAGTSITVNPIIIPAVSISADNSTICAGSSVVFAANVTGGTASYKWKNGNTYITSATNATYSTSTANNGDSYSVEITNNGACVLPSVVVSSQIVVTVNKITTITSQPTDETVCALGNSTAYSVIASGSNLTYQWMKGTTTLANSSTFTGVDTDALTISNISSNELVNNYTVVVTGSCGTVTSSSVALSLSTSPITIIAQPTSQTGQQGDAISLSVVASGPSLIYQWKRNGSAITDDSHISGSTTNVLQLSNAQITDNFSDYVCVVSSACAASVSSNAVTVTVSGTPTAVMNAQSQGFVVSPNPSAGQFVLSNTSAPFNVEEIEIVSMNGVVVGTKAVAGSSYINETIYAQELPSGVYIVIVKGEGQQAFLKIAIDK